LIGAGVGRLSTHGREEREEFERVERDGCDDDDAVARRTTLDLTRRPRQRARGKALRCSSGAGPWGKQARGRRRRLRGNR
jgi:hypothetical protein